MNIEWTNCAEQMPSKNPFKKVIYQLNTEVFKAQSLAIWLSYKLFKIMWGSDAPTILFTTYTLEKWRQLSDETER